MLMYNNCMGIVLDEERKGFTIVEVMLFLALSGFLLVGILVGTGSNIANQRYKDAVEDAVDALRSAYSFVADTQVQTRETNMGVCGNTVDGKTNSDGSDKNTGRGRTTCAVYGAVVTIKGDTIQTTSLIGRDYYDFINTLDSDTPIDSDTEIILNPSSSDTSLLKALHANNLAYQCPSNNTACKTVGVAGSVRTRKLKWDTVFKTPNSVSGGKNEDLELTLLIYRSPRTGAIRTLVMYDTIKYNGVSVDYEKDSLMSLNQQGVYKYLGADVTGKEQLKQDDIYLCVDSNGSESYSSHNRIIHIVKNAHSQTGVVLEEMDKEIKKGDTIISCDK